VTLQRQRIGRRGEELARAHLQELGWRVIEANARTRYGEIDIVAADGSALVFVEVKTLRAGSPFGSAGPLEGIGPRKRLQVRRLARAWLAERQRSPPGGGRFELIRFDAIGVVLGAGGELLELEHVPAAF
jgi:putative endonuclease